jgi:hypothetical protein
MEETIVFLLASNSSMELWETHDSPPAFRRTGSRPPTLHGYKNSSAAD